MLSAIVGVLIAILVAALLVAAFFVYKTRSIARAAEKAVPARGTFVDVGGNRLHYVEEGEGRPILFIHGLGGTLHHLRHPLFGGKLPGYRLIALDRPGAGHSTRAPGASARLTEQAAVIAGFIDRLELEKPLVVGHSLGGAIALALALDHPDKISGLVLVSALTTHRDEVPPELAPIYIRSTLKRRLLAETVAVPTSLKLAPQTLAYVFGPQEVPDGYMTDGGGQLGLRPGQWYAMVSDLVAVADDMPAILARLGEIAMPAAMVFGTADRVLDYRANGAGFRDRLPDVDFEVLDGVGHHPQYAEPERVLAVIRRTAERAFSN
jgi:pimeloyl-ACP methyl ester carboxylesterase